MIRLNSKLKLLKKYCHCEPEGRSNLKNGIASSSPAGTPRNDNVGFQILISIAFVFIFISPSFAQDADRVGAVTQKILKAQKGDELYAAFEELTDLYFKENKYNEFVEFLKSLSSQNSTLEPAVNYYIGLSRYYQLKYLEESQSWDEYFNQGNNYRDQITLSLEKTIGATLPEESLHLYARLLLWKFHRDQQTALSEPALDELINSTFAYANASANLAPLEDVANQLSLYGEKARAKEIYKIYVDKVLGSEVKDEELNRIASGFYDAGNLELAETFYDAYLGRIRAVIPKEKLIPILTDIARKFCYRQEKVGDIFYAEKIFQEISDADTTHALDEDTLYLRAYSLEKAKDFNKARGVYLDLISRYPAAANADKINYKVGLFNAYILRDREGAKAIFKKLAEKEGATYEGLAGLYQLGLFSQWEDDLESAKASYAKLLEKAKEGYAEFSALVKERLKEIEDGGPIEFNLKTFLDASFKEDNAGLQMQKIELKPSAYNAKAGQDIELSVISNLAQTGCLQVEMSYLWSGELGQAKPALEESFFHTIYSDNGTKAINLVVVAPDGIIDRAFDLVDIE